MRIQTQMRSNVSRSEGVIPSIYSSLASPELSSVAQQACARLTRPLDACIVRKQRVAMQLDLYRG
jgi:hypothetical protein